MKNSVYKTLCLALGFSSCISAQTFDKSFAIGVIGQISAAIYPFKNNNLNIQFADSKEVSRLQRMMDGFKRGLKLKQDRILEIKTNFPKLNIIYNQELDKYESTPGKEREYIITEAKKYIDAYNSDSEHIARHQVKLDAAKKGFKEQKDFSKNNNLSGSFGIKMMKSISKNWVLDLSLFGSKDIHTGAIEIENEIVRFAKEDNLLKNISAELNLGFLYNLASLSETISVYAGAGGIVNYNFVDKHIKKAIEYGIKDGIEYHSRIDETVSFNANDWGFGGYITIQFMSEVSESVLVGTGLKLYGTFLNSPFGDVSSIPEIQHADLIETGLSGIFYITYLI